MLDKNPKQVLDNDLQRILKKFADKNPNIVLCSDPFLKSHFLIELTNSIDHPVIFLDFDLLYSGYVSSKMISKKSSVEVYCPDKDNLNEIFSEVVKKISEKKYLVILDSFNGFYNLFSEIESGIFINAIIMLLTSVGKQKNSIVIVSGMARKKENEGWVLLPGGRHIIESNNSGVYFIKNNEKSDFEIIES